MNYGNKLKVLRKENGLNQKQLSEKLNVHQGTVSAWEKSHYQPLEAIEKVCQFYKISVWQFFLPTEMDQSEIIPSYIKPDQAELLRFVNTKFDAETRIEFWKLFEQTLKGFAVASGIKLD